MEKILVLFSLCLLLTIAHAVTKQAEKFHCYYCDNSETKECGDPFDGKYIPRLTCAVAGSAVKTSSPFYHLNENRNITAWAQDSQCGCYKIVVNNKYGDKIGISRGSVMGEAVNDPKICKMLNDSVKSQSNNQYHLGFCQGCDNELCNSAGTVSISVLTVLSTIVSYMLFV